MKIKTIIWIILSINLLSTLETEAQTYLDPKAPINDRVEDLLQRMTLEEKIGQMTQGERGSVQNSNLEDIKTYYLGSVLSGGGSVPYPNTVEGWQNMYNAMQEMARSTRLGIPILYGVDAVHGHNNLVNAVIFPHNIGLGCTRDPELVTEITRITAMEVRASGPEWTFSPCITVPQNEFWGRTYEGFSESTTLVDSMAEAAVLGYQSDSLGTEYRILACAKHFLGDGGTENGIDQGNTILPEEELRQIHLPPYKAAIKAGVGSVMASFNSWNGEKCHGRKDLLTDLLKVELGFDGFVVSDWNGINQVDDDFKTAIEKSINAGVDMAMQPNNYTQFITLLTELVNEGKVSQDRIDDAVRRILKVKFQMGLFENSTAPVTLIDSVGCQAHREVGRRAVRESLVLLKNNGILPLKKNNSKVLVAGFKGNDVGAMCGGWTITWQGQFGKTTEGTTILAGLKNALGSTNVVYSNSANSLPDADYAVVVVGEQPYAESGGDLYRYGSNGFQLSADDKALVSAVKAKNIPMVVILFSGRPLDIRPELNASDAFIAAWLPGSEGGSGIADVLVGDYAPTGKLSHTWPESFDDVPINVSNLNNHKALFNYGYGLTYYPTGISKTQRSDNSIKAYPNPFQDELNFDVEPGIDTKIVIYDLSGRTVFYKNNMVEKHNQLYLNSLDDGVYTLVIYSKNKTYQQRIIKKQNF